MRGDAMSELATWDSFYVIVGSAAGALIGLQFVVVTLIAQRPMRAAPEASAAFGTPTIVHFGTALLLAALARVPWQAISLPAILWAAIGLCGVIYSLNVIWRMRTQGVYEPEFEDWLFHVVLPIIAYAILALSAVAALSHARESRFASDSTTREKELPLANVEPLLEPLPDFYGHFDGAIDLIRRRKLPSRRPGLSKTSAAVLLSRPATTGRWYSESDSKKRQLRDGDRHPLGRSRYRLVLNRHSQHRDLCRSAARCGDRQPRAQLGTALTRIGTWSDAATPARQSRRRTIRRTVTHREIPSVGRGAQCGRAAAYSEAGDCERIPSDYRWHHYGGAIPADKCAARWVLHAEHAAGPALHRTVARLNFHPRGVASEAADR